MEGNDFENIDARLRKCLLRAQQRLSLAALLEPNSTGDSDSENRWRNGFRKYRCAMAKALAHSATALRVLQRAFEPNSAGDSENRERIWFRKDPCAMVKARWPGISTAMISTLEHVENRERIGLRKDRCAMANARWSGISSAIISTLDDVETAVKCDFLQE